MVKINPYDDMPEPSKAFKLSATEILFAQSNTLMLTRLAQWHDAEEDRAKRETKPEHVAWHHARAKELRDEVARLAAC